MNAVDPLGLGQAYDHIGKLLLCGAVQIRESPFRHCIACISEQNKLSGCLVQTCVPGSVHPRLIHVDAGEPLVLFAVPIEDAPNFFRCSTLYCDNLQIPEGLAAQGSQCLIQFLRLIVYWYDY